MYTCILGTQQNVLNIEVSLFQGCPLKRGSTGHTKVRHVGTALASAGDW